MRKMKKTKSLEQLVRDHDRPIIKDIMRLIVKSNNQRKGIKKMVEEESEREYEEQFEKPDTSTIVIRWIVIFAMVYFWGHLVFSMIRDYFGV